MTPLGIASLPLVEHHEHRHYHQHAADTFSVAVVPGTNHCGIDERRGHFKYCVDIIYRDGALDEKGFLLDNLLFQQYFDSLPPVTESCEQLGDRASRYFLSQLGERAGFVESINVRIYPFGDVFVEEVIEL